MALPSRLQGTFRIPAIAAPMFLVSGPDLVISTCRSGVIGTFPALNARTTEELDDWLGQINSALAEPQDGVVSPYGVNITVARDRRARLEADMAVCAKHEVPIIITSVGHPGEAVKMVHDYGGLVFHDVTTMRHAAKAAEAGVDGLILVCAGAGGHAGPVSPFALVEQVREIFDGVIVVAGGISTGRAVRSAEVLGGDLAYLGTRFIATREAMADAHYKQMLVDGETKDIVYTNAISGVPASFIRQSLEEAGLDPDNLPPPKGVFQPDLPDDVKAWRNALSAGHGIGMIKDVPSVAELCDRLAAEYEAAGGSLG